MLSSLNGVGWSLCAWFLFASQGKPDIYVFFPIQHSHLFFVIGWYRPKLCWRELAPGLSIVALAQKYVLTSSLSEPCRASRVFTLRVLGLVRLTSLRLLGYLLRASRGDSICASDRSEVYLR